MKTPPVYGIVLNHTKYSTKPMVFRNICLNFNKRRKAIDSTSENITDYVGADALRHMTISESTDLR